MSLKVELREGALFFEVRVAPRASREALIGVHEGALKIALTAPPVEGAANTSLIAFVAESLGVAKRDVTIVRGDRARNKRLRVVGVSEAALYTWLATLTRA